MVSHFLTVCIDDSFIAYSADVKGVITYGETAEEAAQAFKEGLSTRITDSDGGVFIIPSTFLCQRRELSKFLEVFVTDGASILYDSITEHVFKMA
jgi:hypothetical protein